MIRPTGKSCVGSGTVVCWLWWYCFYGEVKGRSHMFENACFATKFGKPRQTNSSSDMCLVLRSLVSRLLHFFLGLNCPFLTLIGNIGLKPCRAAVLDWN